MSAFSAGPLKIKFHSRPSNGFFFKKSIKFLFSLKLDMSRFPHQASKIFRIRTLRESKNAVKLAFNFQVPILGNIEISVGRSPARDTDRPGPSNIKREPLELRDDSNFSNM
jgi:hypothetical protein